MTNKNPKALTKFSLAAGLFISMAALSEAHAGAVITNGTVSLGVNDLGALNFDGVGLAFNSTGNDSTFAGCQCEGWGAGVVGIGSGFQNISSGTDNVSLVSFSSTASTALSVVDIVVVGGTLLRVTHDYRPSALTANLYQVRVNIQNVSGGVLGDTTVGSRDLRYRRVMDWDIEPTPFSEFVTIQGWPAVNLVRTHNNGFNTADPLVPGDPIPDNTCAEGDASIPNTNFEDCGAADHGAQFDFGFEGLLPGEARSLTIFYGATGTEAAADAARALAGIEVYSYGQASTVGGPTEGTPNTFIFGFAGVGGTPPPPPPDEVPLPGTLVLLGLGMIGLGAVRKRSVK